MTGKKPSSIEPIMKVVSRNPTEHLLNLLKATLASAPFAGGIASLMTDYIPSMKQTRMEKFVAQLGEDLSALEKQVDESAILTDEFAFMFEKCFRGVAENYKVEKLEAFRGILVNTAVGIDLDSDEREYFLSLVDSLSALHLRILSFMTRPNEYLEARNIPVKSISGGFSNFFLVAIPRVDLEVVKSAFGDLYQAGLINTDKSIFSTMTSGSGMDLLGDRVSHLGKSFVLFCTSPTP